MSDPEAEQGEQGYEESPEEPGMTMQHRQTPLPTLNIYILPLGSAGPGSEAPSPSRIDNGLDTIIDIDPQTQHAEEGSNTAYESEQPDVISSYTGGQQEEDGEQAGNGAIDETTEVRHGTSHRALLTPPPSPLACPPGRARAVWLRPMAPDTHTRTNTSSTGSSG